MEWGQFLQASWSPFSNLKQPGDLGTPTIRGTGVQQTHQGAEDHVHLHLGYQVAAEPFLPKGSGWREPGGLTHFVPHVQQPQGTSVGFWGSTASSQGEDCVHACWGWWLSSSVFSSHSRLITIPLPAHHSPPSPGANEGGLNSELYSPVSSGPWVVAGGTKQETPHPLSHWSGNSPPSSQLRMLDVGHPLPTPNLGSTSFSGIFLLPHPSSLGRGTKMKFLILFFVLRHGFPCSHSGLKLSILLPVSPEGWNYRCAPPLPAKVSIEPQHCLLGQAQVYRETLWKQCPQSQLSL